MNNINKFSNKATKYSNYRPKYPNELIDYLIESANLQSDSVVVDVGCGTGILTKQLLDSNIKTIGVEPNIEMYNQAIKYLQGYDCQLINASAENTQLNNSIANLVTVAQALHWFDLDKFICEYNRILKSDGQVAILYNNMDKNDIVVSKFLNIHRTLCPSYCGFSKGINNHKDIYTEMFGENNFTTSTFENNQVLNYEAYMGYIESLSYSLNENDKNYEKYMFALNEIFNMYSNSGNIEFPTTTTLVLSKKRIIKN